MKKNVKLGAVITDDSGNSVIQYEGDKIFPGQDKYTFLDTDAFKSGDGVCYIPDIAFVEYSKKHSAEPQFNPGVIPAAEIKAQFIYDKPKLVQAFGGDEQLASMLVESLIFARPEAYKKAYDSLFGKSGK